MWVRIRLMLCIALAVGAGEPRAAAAAPPAVLTLAPSPGNPRNSEGDFVQLRDGRILFVYTHFTGGAGDHDRAHLAGRFSRDGGRTWTTEDVTVVPEDAGVRNAMSVSLLRLQDGRIAMFYLLKRSMEDCRPVMRVSSDEARTWSPAQPVIPDGEAAYYVVNNDRVVQLRGQVPLAASPGGGGASNPAGASAEELRAVAGGEAAEESAESAAAISTYAGRLVVPVSRHAGPGQPWSANGTIMCYLSDDAGRTWRRSRTQIREPGTLQEPGVVELRDGRLMMYCRTIQGSQYVAFSEDGGDTWSRPQPSNIVSPRSPASIERIPATGDLLLIWNDNYEKDHPAGGRRTPLCSAISRDEGRTWSHRQVLEDNPHGWFCYTAIEFVGDHVLLAYCAGDRRENNGLALTRIVRVPVDALYADSN